MRRQHSRLRPIAAPNGRRIGEPLRSDLTRLGGPVRRRGGADIVLVRPLAAVLGRRTLGGRRTSSETRAEEAADNVAAGS
eukprot:3003803-Prymnesium_polylepis.1